MPTTPKGSHAINLTPATTETPSAIPVTQAPSTARGVSGTNTKDSLIGVQLYQAVQDLPSSLPPKGKTATHTPTVPAVTSGVVVTVKK